MYEVASEFQDMVGIYIVSLPENGILTNKGIPLKVADIVTLSDIQNGTLQYTAEQQPVYSRDQFLMFRLYRQNYGVIYNQSEYSSCLKPLINQSIPLPDGMLYVMKFTTIAKDIPVSNIKSLSMRDNETKVIDRTIFQTSCGDFTDDQILITVLNNPLGRLSISTTDVTTFSMKEISSGKVSFVPQIVGKSSIDFRICSPESKCITVSMPIEVKDHLVVKRSTTFYVKVETSWYIDISDPNEQSIFSIVGGTNEGPYLSPLPSPGSILPSTRCGSSSLTPLSKDGPGWSNLPQYRNVQVQYWWDGGLPLGCMLTQTGQLLMAAQQSTIPTNSWVMDKLPREYKFLVRRTNPKTGNYQDTEYKIISTLTGYGPDGQIEE